MAVSERHAAILRALRRESEILFRINLKILQLGGEPIPPRSDYLGNDDSGTRKGTAQEG